MSLIVKSLDASVTIGPGATVWFDVPKTTITLQATCAASNSSNATVALEVTIDGVNFLSRADIVVGGAPQAWGTSDGYAVIGARAKLLSLNTANAPVTATIAAA